MEGTAGGGGRGRGGVGGEREKETSKVKDQFFANHGKACLDVPYISTSWNCLMDAQNIQIISLWNTYRPF